MYNTNMFNVCLMADLGVRCFIRAQAPAEGETGLCREAGGREGKAGSGKERSSPVRPPLPPLARSPHV